jgi:hypothetical protein
VVTPSASDLLKAGCLRLRSRVDRQEDGTNDGRIPERLEPDLPSHRTDDPLEAVDEISSVRSEHATCEHEVERVVFHPETPNDMRRRGTQRSTDLDEDRAGHGSTRSAARTTPGLERLRAVTTRR